MSTTPSPERSIDGVLSHKFTLTEEEIHVWAFDDQKELLEQDEDLVIGNETSLYPTFVELALDPDCPKAAHIRDSIDLHIVYYVYGGWTRESVFLIDSLISLLPSSEAAASWRSRLLKLKSVSLSEDSPIDEKKALETATLIWAPYYSHDDVRNFCVKEGSTEGMHVWRVYAPSWGIYFDRRTGRMARLDVSK